MIRIPATAALVAAVATSAGAIELRFPVDCELGRTCVIQQYVDRDTGPGALDHACGTLAYDGHKGTDIRLPSRAAMAEGVDVLAAAPGRVAGTRDGMPDIAPGESGAPQLDGRDCGNGVRIEHADGWSTQYCHMKMGSIAVGTGDEVAAGQRLGQIGLSGNAEFPHLHLTLRDREDRVVDPFDAAPMDERCGTGGTSLWAEPVPYVPGGILSAGIAPGVPDYAEIRAEAPHSARLPADAPALVAWIHAYGLAEGDELVVELRGPDGRRFSGNTHRMDRNRAVQFRASGRRRPAGGWPPGTYTARVLLRRDRRTIDERTVETRIGD